jgi:hypothetical protein
MQMAELLPAELVAQLRLVRPKAKYEYAKDQHLMIGKVMREAADEIERLNAYVEDILTKDRLKTREINILTPENRKLREALECLLPGLILDLRYAGDDDDRDAMRSRIDTVQQALDPSSASTRSVTTKGE